MMRLIAANCLLGTLALVASPAAQAEEPASRPAGAHDAPSDGAHQDRRVKRRQEIRRKVEVVRIMRLTEELNLDPETGARVVPLFKRFDELEQAHRKQRMQLGRELNQALQSGAGDDVLDGLMERMFDAEEQHVRQRRALFGDLGGVLSTEQQARFLLFIPRFQREMREIVRDLSKDRRGDRRRGRGDGPRGHDRPSGERGMHGRPDMPPGGEPGRPPPDWFGDAVEER